MYEIKTSSYVKTKSILVDGNEWTMTAPGAGDELAISQANRRINQLEKKIKDEIATDEDYDMYDKLENKVFFLLVSIFKDKTKDNSQVKAWLNSTPLAIIMQIIEDIKKQIEEKDGKELPKNTTS